MAKVERRHREAAFHCYWGVSPSPGRPNAHWVETGEGKLANGAVTIPRTAQALADVEHAERVMACDYLRAEHRQTTAPAALADLIELGHHARSAS
jgi:hypothetical protein